MHVRLSDDSLLVVDVKWTKCLKSAALHECIVKCGS